MPKNGRPGKQRELLLGGYEIVSVRWLHEEIAQSRVAKQTVQKLDRKNVGRLDWAAIRNTLRLRIYHKFTKGWEECQELRATDNERNDGTGSCLTAAQYAAMKRVTNLSLSSSLNPLMSGLIEWWAERAITTISTPQACDNSRERDQTPGRNKSGRLPCRLATDLCDRVSR